MYFIVYAAFMRIELMMMMMMIATLSGSVCC